MTCELCGAPAAPAPDDDTLEVCDSCVRAYLEQWSRWVPSLLDDPFDDPLR